MDTEQKYVLEQAEKMDKLALEVLHLSRNTLLANLRFLDMALSRFEYLSCRGFSLMTDGRRLIYDPAYILRCYKKERQAPVRDYLHLVLHCVYRHMFTTPDIRRPLWDLACDMAVENIITELDVKAASARRAARQSAELIRLRADLPILTAETIYAYYRDKGLTNGEAEELRESFYGDYHGIWYMSDKERENRLNDYDDRGKEEAHDDSVTSGGSSTAPDKGSAPPENDEQKALAEMWEDIARRIQEDLETFSRDHGGKAGSMMQNLAAVNRERYDYSAFLKKFAVLGEHMKINDDEFDNIFYTYGLQLYSKMPLIEPLEYKEVKRIREFVIAIDTSGSVSGETVQGFIEKTYNILNSTQSFFSKVNIHIIQCDAAIQEHTKITCQKDFDEYISRMQIHGMGGTDFRPVFTLVDQLIRDDEFTDLRGLIYFTDGYGDFPAKKPSYDTAFVFLEDNFHDPEVPPWVIKLILSKEELDKPAETL